MRVWTYATDVALERVETGIYRIDVDLDAVGVWHWRWEGDGAAKATSEGSVAVGASKVLT